MENEKTTCKATCEIKITDSEAFKTILGATAELIQEIALSDYVNTNGDELKLNPRYLGLMVTILQTND